MAEDPDFKYIVRIANTDLDGEEQVAVALSHVKGIGTRIALTLADLAEVPRWQKIGNLDDESVDRIQATLDTLPEKLPPWLLNRTRDWETGEDLHLIGPDLDLTLRDDLNRLKKIRSYRGVRHEQGQKVRGQRTRSNGRTGLTVGVQRRQVQQAQSGGKE